MSLARDPLPEREEGPAGSGPGLRSLPGGRDRHKDTACARGSVVVAEALWHGGGTRDAYEALLTLLLSPEPEPVREADE